MVVCAALKARVFLVAPEGSGVAKTDMQKPPKGYQFLGDSKKGTEFIIHKHWTSMLPATDEHDHATKVKFHVGFNMNAVLHLMPTFSDNDFIIVQRKIDGKMEDAEVQALHGMFHLMWFGSIDR